MYKLIYICPTIISGNASDGVAKKVMKQFCEFSKEFDAYLIGYSNDGLELYHNMDKNSTCYKSKMIHKRYDLYKIAQKIITENQIGLVYIRYGYCENAFINLLKQIKKSKIILEIPTYPYDVEMNKSFKYRLFRIIDQATRNKMKKYVSRIATFSTDQEIFSIPCINIMNGIDVDSIALKKSTESTVLNLLAIASMGRWHGYDRLIEGLHDYCSGGGTEAIVLHLVGDGAEMPRYRQLVHQYQLEDTVIFHGFKSGVELDALYNQCQIAVASLGMHRMNIFLASTLKTREYGAKGIPMVTSCEIDAFPSKTCDYILKTPEDESNIDINQMIRFYHSLIGKYGSEEHLAQQMRSDTRARCDMSVVMKPIVDCFNA